MRIAAFAVVATLAGFAGAAAVADPAPSQITLAETWVGSWTGKATWQECSLEGGSTITLPIQSLGSTLTSDGDILMEGLGALVWSSQGKQLVIARDGLDVTLTPGKKGAVKLMMKTGAGCVARATLERASSGIASCDAVRALATARSTCDGLDEATRDDELEQVDASWKAWNKLKGKKKKAQAKACTARLSGLRTDIASCSPSGGGVTIAGGSCAQMIALYTSLGNCAALPQQPRDAILQALPTLQQTMMSEADCKAMVDQLTGVLPSLGCTP